MGWGSSFLFEVGFVEPPLEVLMTCLRCHSKDFPSPFLCSLRFVQVWWTNFELGPVCLLSLSPDFVLCLCYVDNPVKILYCSADHPDYPDGLCSVHHLVTILSCSVDHLDYVDSGHSADHPGLSCSVDHPGVAHLPTGLACSAALPWPN